jgi:hypothetical protein
LNRIDAAVKHTKRLSRRSWLCDLAGLALVFLGVVSVLAHHAHAIADELRLHPCMADTGLTDGVTMEQKTAERVFVRFFSCVSRNKDQPSRCNTFTAEALQSLYQLEEVYGRDHSFLRTADLASTILNSKQQWILVGKAADQQALREARRLVESGTPTVAVLKNAKGESHVAVILPGALRPSPKWNGVLTPNSASFVHTAAPKSFIGCKLSYAFASPKGVLLYYRARR